MSALLGHSLMTDPTVAWCAAYVSGILLLAFARAFAEGR